MAENVTFRPASADDYEEVMELDRAIEGSDYLPTLYHNYLDRFHCFVGIIDGEIVAFGGSRLIDDGKNLTTVALRIKVKFQGKRILPKLLNHIFQYFKDSPSLVLESMDVSNIILDSHPSLLKTYKIIDEMKFAEYKCFQDDFKLPVNNNPEHAVQEIRNTELAHLFNSPESNLLFPHQIIFAGFHSFGLLSENIPFIQDGRQMYASKLNGKYKVASNIETYHHTDNNMFRCHVNIFGSNKVIIKSHLINHAVTITETISKKSCDMILFHIMYRDETVGQFVNKILTSFGLTHCKSRINKVVHLERDFRAS